MKKCTGKSVLIQAPLGFGIALNESTVKQMTKKGKQITTKPVFLYVLNHISLFTKEKINKPDDAKSIPIEYFASIGPKLLTYAAKYKNLGLDIRVHDIVIETFQDPTPINKQKYKIDCDGDVYQIHHVIKMHMLGYRSGYDWVGDDNPPDLAVLEEKNWKKK
jgi:hypothetical protein